MKGRIRAAAVVFSLSAVMSVRPLAAQGQGFFITDNLGYSATVTCYFDLTSAQNRTGTTCGSTTPVQRDLGMMFNDGNPALSSSVQSVFVTNNYSAVGNPNNVASGRITDYSDATEISSLTTSWDDTKTVFSLAVTGANPPICSVSTCGLLWTGGSSWDTGSFVSWNVNAIFSGFAEATYDATTGDFVSQSDPTSVLGSITGVFRDSNGLYYDLSADINLQSWAVDNGYGTNTLAASAMVNGVVATPEPATLALFATGLIGVGGFAARRRRKEQASA